MWLQSTRFITAAVYTHFGDDDSATCRTIWRKTQVARGGADPFSDKAAKRGRVLSGHVSSTEGRQWRAAWPIAAADDSVSTGSAHPQGPPGLLVAMHVYYRTGVVVHACLVDQKCERDGEGEQRKFSLDPQITSFEVLQSLLARAFDIRG
ncbi:hypothetical protein MTO96_031300 [Rhipicephalus appendiculatus]